MYHSSRVARDRDRLREQVLAGLGWKLHRIWGPSWYHNRPGEERRLRAAIERSLTGQAAPGAGANGAPRQPVVLEFEPLARDAAPSWSKYYEVATLQRGRAFDPTTPDARSELRTMILKTVDVEGPIVDDLLARRVIGAWRMNLTEKRRAAVQRVVKDLLGAGTLTRCGNAVSTPTQRTDVVRGPHDFDEASEREVRHVPDVELAEAVAQLVAEGRIITDDELQQRTARLFGWKRNGPAIQAALTRALEKAIDSGRVIRADGYLEASDHPMAAEDAA
jgi:Arc/MetJ family transcription regulator